MVVFVVVPVLVVVSVVGDPGRYDPGDHQGCQSEQEEVPKVGVVVGLVAVVLGGGVVDVVVTLEGGKTQ